MFYFILLNLFAYLYKLIDYIVALQS